MVQKSETQMPIESRAIMQINDKCGMGVWLRDSSELVEYMWSLVFHGSHLLYGKANEMSPEGWEANSAGSVRA